MKDNLQPLISTVNSQHAHRSWVQWSVLFRFRVVSRLEAHQEMSDWRFLFIAMQPLDELILPLNLVPLSSIVIFSDSELDVASCSCFVFFLSFNLGPLLASFHSFCLTASIRAVSEFVSLRVHSFFCLSVFVFVCLVMYAWSVFVLIWTTTSSAL